MKCPSITLGQARLTNDDLQGQGQIPQEAQPPDGQFLLESSTDPSRHAFEEIHEAGLYRSKKQAHSPSRIIAHKIEVVPRLERSRAKSQTTNLIHRGTGKQAKESLGKQIVQIDKDHSAKKVQVNPATDPITQSQEA